MDKFKWIAGALIVLWFLSGDPIMTVTNWFWPDSAAPWESVNAFYYPDKNDLTQDERRIKVGTLNDCRQWVQAAALTHGDFYMQNGDYECGIGCKPVDGDMYLCRLTIR